jgi:hypothetical protein
MKQLILTLLVSLSVVFAAAMPAAAWDPFGGAGCDSGQAASSTVCSDAKQQAGKSNPLTGSDGLIVKVANIIAIIAGLAAVIMIILAGLRLIQSGGSSEDVAGARRTIIYAAVGLVVIGVSRALLGLVLNAL